MDPNTSCEQDCEGLDSCDECKYNKVELIQDWIQNEAPFYGRNDKEFVLMFLYGCKFNVEKTKVKLNAYYECRKNLPQWWANRNLLDPIALSFLQNRMQVMMKASEEPQPTVILTFYSKIKKAEHFDDMLKFSGINLDIAMRRNQTQKYGVYYIFDCRDYSMPIALRFLNPMVAKNTITSFNYGLPLRTKSAVIVNTPYLASIFFKLIAPFLPQKIKQRIHFLGSDLSKLSEYIPKELLPDEYGGCAGPLAKHHEAFQEEYHTFVEYLADDEQYGFQ